LNLIRVMPAKGKDVMQTSFFLTRLIGPVALAIGVSISINVGASLYPLKNPPPRTGEIQ
jgi:hypothetical protein